MRQEVRRWQTPILPWRGYRWLTAVGAGLRGAGRGRTGGDLGRLRQLLAGGIGREFRSLCQRQHLAEDANVLLTEQRSLPDPDLRLGVRQTGDVVVVLALRAAAEHTDEVSVQRM